MKIVRHDSYIKTRKRNAKLVAALGFLLLVGTLFLALNPQLLIVSYILMLGGFVLFNVGMQQVGKWTRNPRNDQAIDHFLKGLPDRYTIVHYAAVGKKRVEHVLVHPGGATVLTSREVDGSISEQKSRWRRRGSGIRRFLSFSGPQLGNPSVDTEESIKRLEEFLAANSMEADVDGAVVFLHPQVELEIVEPDFPVLHGDELPTFVHRLPVDATFTATEREQLVSLLANGAVAVEATKPGATPSTTTTVKSSSRRRPVKRSSGVSTPDPAATGTKRRTVKSTAP